jgi:hypothetical protein
VAFGRAATPFALESVKELPAFRPPLWQAIWARLELYPPFLYPALA